MKLSEWLDWAKKIEPLNALVLVKAVWKCAGGGMTMDRLIYLPTNTFKRVQPFTLAVVLHPGTGYINDSTGEYMGNVLKAGDIVMANQYTAFQMEVDKKLVNYIPQNFIIAKITNWETADKLLEDAGA